MSEHFSAVKFLNLNRMGRRTGNSLQRREILFLWVSLCVLCSFSVIKGLSIDTVSFPKHIKKIFRNILHGALDLKNRIV